MKKALALMLSIMMVMSLCVVSVSAEAVNNFANGGEGVLLSYDFSSNIGLSSLATKTREIQDGGATNKVWSNTIGGTVSAAQWDLQRSSSAVSIGSGTLTIEMDVMVDGSYEGNYLNANNYYSTAEFGVWTNNYENIGDAASAYIRMVAIGNTGIKEDNKGGFILVPGTDFYVASVYGNTVANGDAKYHFSADVWHDLKIVVDYEAGNTVYYLDNNEIGTVAASVPLIAGDYIWLLGTSEGTSANFPAGASGSDFPYVNLDNLTVTYALPSVDPDAPTGDDVLAYETFTLGTWDKFNTSNRVNTVISDGQMLVKRPDYPNFMVTGLINTTDTFEFSCDVYGKAEAGNGTRRISVLDGTTSCQMFVYTPGRGFTFTKDRNAPEYAATDDSKTYTVKMEWNNTSNYIYWSVYEKGEASPIIEEYAEKSTLSYYADVKTQYAMNNISKISFWVEGVESATNEAFAIDNIVLRKLATPQSFEKPFLKIEFAKQKVNDEDVVTYSAFIDGSKTLEESDYFNVWGYHCNVGDTIILAAYDENDYLLGALPLTMEASDSYDDSYGKYLWKNHYAPASFNGAVKVKGFVLSGYADGGVQPVTFAKTGYFAALAE